jgi:hypothetical protein
MGAMQTKIMNSIKSIVKERGLDFEPEYRFSNLGEVYIRDGFDSVLSFHFQFNSDYCTLQFYPAGKKAVGTCGFTDPTCILNCYIAYNESQKFKDILSFVESNLIKFKKVSNGEIHV